MTTMLQPTTTVLLLIDIQGKLAQLMHAKARLFDNLQKLVRGIRVLDIPVLWVEQNPAGLGPTIDEVATLLPDLEPIPKMSFSACGNENFVAALKDAARHQVLVAGIETHICVYQRPWTSSRWATKPTWWPMPYPHGPRKTRTSAWKR